MENRVIKFRVRHTGGHIITYECLEGGGWKHLLLNNHQNYDGVFNDKEFGHKKACVREQYIGKSDKKGDHIFEGDILFVKGNKEITKKEYLNQKYVIEWDSVHCNFWAKPLAKKYHSGLFLPHLCSYAEIIGNINEKKKLKK